MGVYRVLKNPSTSDIVDYPIEEFQVDEDGNPLIDPDTQQGIGTGKTLTWSLKAGETLRFPKYVADILIDRFQFLVETFRNIKTEAESEEAPEVEPSDGVIKCKVCEKPFTNVRALAMHMGIKHPEAILSGDFNK